MLIMRIKNWFMLRRINFLVLILIALNTSLSAIPPDSPISPLTMKGLLGRGFDCSWVEFNKNIQGYNKTEVIAHKAKGFQNARLRTMLAADAAFFTQMDKVINDCLSNGTIPIIAHNSNVYELSPTVANMRADSIWWATVAAHYKDYSHKLIFDINIEWSDVGGKDVAGVNNYYAHITPAIRVTNPTRILVYSPTHLSTPEYLSQLVIPASAGQYAMAEWHLYAAGPSSDPTSPRYWTTGTAAQKKVITDEINIGAAWEKSSGIPCWVGAWMAGDYNNGNTFDAAHQAEFASFMVSEFNRINVPWSINTEDSYYDYLNSKWIDSMLVVLNVLSPITNPPSAVLNPIETNVKLSSNTLIFEDTRETKVEIHSLDGMKVYESQTSEQRYKLPIQKLPTGVYLVTASRNGDKIFTGKTVR